MLLYIAVVTPIGWIKYYGAFHIITSVLGATVMVALAACTAWIARRVSGWSDAAAVSVAVGIAVALRALWVALVDTSPTSDFLEYHRYATEVAHGDVLAHGWFFVVFPFKVVYALMLGGIYAITTPLPYVAGIVNIIATCGIVVMMYVIAHCFVRYGHSSLSSQASQHKSTSFSSCSSVSSLGCLQCHATDA
jgi:hypothetical protein